MEIETKACVSFARTSLVNDGQDENGRNFKTLVYAFKLRRHLYQNPQNIHMDTFSWRNLFPLWFIRNEAVAFESSTKFRFD